MTGQENSLKSALARGDMLLGLWLNAGSAVVSEIAGATGFDWCLVDGEHGPWDPGGLADQLRALALGGTPAVLRVPVAEDWIIKQALDLGAETLLVPMVDSAEEARAVVRATRYPPEGVRGLGASVARVSGYGREAGYAARANRSIGVIVQAESRAALAALDEIAAVEGVDGVFIGPADLSADMGFPGNPGAPEVVAAIEDAVRRIRAAGKAAGIIHDDPARFGYYAGLGVNFLGIGADVTLLRQALAAQLQAARAATGR